MASDKCTEIVFKMPVKSINPGLFFPSEWIEMSAGNRQFDLLKNRIK